MRKTKITLLIFFCLINYLNVLAQYTEQINSNRPGYSIGAFSVGKGVIQAETGFEIRNYKHNNYNESKVNGTVAFLSLRWGFLFEQLELTYDGSYMFDKFTNNIPSIPIEKKRSGFLQNFMGIKYLVFDPYKKEKEVNNYSWKANNGFKIKDLIPAVSITVGANYDPFIEENPYPYGDLFAIFYRPIFNRTLFYTPPTPSPLSLKGIIATQSHFLSTWVFVTNFSLKKYLSDFVEKNYILTLTHTFSPVWSVYIENQGIISERYSDNFFRAGAAYLVGNNLQVEATVAGNTKSTPSHISLNAGASYRLDFHKDYKDPRKIEKKKMKKEEKVMKKMTRKTNKKEKKRNKRARKKPKQ
ncbi:MAG: hypothetical protein CMC81_05995 [Flavobacteriaceae bacterium]|nr:hypothetical protein [Flavobacteriaceae bacterium]|tara:strand:- start:2581 stop:3648 length:1068 start_codon:yes stop_codon:yes gene_type:complete